tara:strand:+ start:297 stop:884 length:588 start_codon:yes stop_codon:yes gene_type:complete
VKKALMVAALFMTVGCIDIPAMNGLIDRIVPEESTSYQEIEVWNVEGDFAPDPDQDSDALMKAIEDMIDNPLQFQQTAQNLSWKKYEHSFVIESEWQARFVMLLLTVNYDVAGGSDPSEGPAGTLDISIRDPNGGEHGEGYEMVTWNNGINERPYLLPSIYGTWTITISGSGLEGIGSIAYSGDYTIKVTSEKLV